MQGSYLHENLIRRVIWAISSSNFEYNSFQIAIDKGFYNTERGYYGTVPQ